MYDDLEDALIPVLTKSALTVVGAAEQLLQHTITGSNTQVDQLQGYNKVSHNRIQGSNMHPIAYRPSPGSAFPDRIVHFLSELLVSSRPQLDLTGSLEMVFCVITL